MLDTVLAKVRWRRRRTRWVTTAHNWLKTFYVPILFRPHLFLKGGRLLFGDHAMFFRRADFDAVGGFDVEMAVMEEAEATALPADMVSLCQLERL